jgi:hypothetical protein
MNSKDLRPARDFAIQFGVKALIYGAPGSAKTPLINTAPRPVLLACEPGLLSMRNSNVPTYQAFTPNAIDEFFKWFFNSEEVKNFDTLAIDSTSQMADIYLQDALRNNKHGLKAYGEMATKTMEHLRTLYYTRYKHTYLIAKQEKDDTGFIKPFFPGKQLPVDIPHMYDCILHLAIHNVPGVGQVKAFRCHGSIDSLCRDRTGNLAEFEQPNFAALVEKAMK